ncbi:hypothetical protein CYMTET_47444 [Cymbomonas tetramitiformis]|uniref:Nitronate monooxygenase domain-containing protein n=1 Tax=Cymbomonas tetramitiformis TaxID=36881 RepID=A0AAE0BU93_9CHLO|nr:hypothetical protein CYMTET_47444 [Cymbomonas tetramitiformis]
MRATTSCLVSDTAAYIAKTCEPNFAVRGLPEAENSKPLLLAAGGIATGRGVASALALGADGVVVGTRLAATFESAFPEGKKAAIVNSMVCMRQNPAGGIQSTIANNGNKIWPRWPDEDAITESAIANRLDEFDHQTLAGMGVSLINDIKPAGIVIEDMVQECTSTIHMLYSNTMQHPTQLHTNGSDIENHALVESNDAIDQSDPGLN